MNTEECKQQLTEVTQKLNPVLNPLGFVFEDSGSGVSSGGPFAAGFYVNGDKKIGLIYRSLAGLGSVNYEQGQSAISHDDLMRYLGKLDVSKLKYDASKFMSYAKDGGDVLDALVYDIQNFGIDFLNRSDEQFGKILRNIPRTSTVLPDSKVMNGVIIGMIVGGSLGFMLQSLGWGVFIGFVIGLVGGIYYDAQTLRKFAGK